MEVNFASKQIVTTFVDFGNGYWHPVKDLYETLEAVIDGDAVITDDKLGEKLMELGVLTSIGSMSGMTSAEKGPNFNEFYAKISERTWNNNS